MATATVSLASTATVGGFVTAYAPLPSSQPSLIACSTNIYAGGDEGSAQALAFDPYYGLNVRPNEPHCLAEVITSWWWQGTTSTVTTSLGPNFECPPLYYGRSQLLGGGTTQIFCCPTSYTMQSTNMDIPNVATQCYSSVSASQLLVYTSSSISPWTRVLIDVGDDYLVWAPHVNGINVAQSTTSSAATTTSKPSLTSDSSKVTSASTSSSSSATSSPASKSKGLSAGAAAGIGVAATVAVIALAIGGFLFWRRRKARQANNPAELTAMIPGYGEKRGPVSEMEAQSVPVHEIGVQEPTYEMEAMGTPKYQAYRDTK